MYKGTFAYANDIPTVLPRQDETDDDEELPMPEQNIGELQENCQDFKQIFKYLKDGTLQVETNAAEMIIAESKHFNVRNRMVSLILFNKWHYRKFFERMHYCHTMTALQEEDIWA